MSTLLTGFRKLYEESLLENLGFRKSSQGLWYNPDFIMESLPETEYIWLMYRRGSKEVLARGTFGEILKELFSL